MKFIGIARTLIRYWQMAHDPRTPKAVRYMIYAGLAYSLSPIDLLPDWIPGVGLLDDAAVLPGIIALSMMMIPQQVKEQHEAKSEKGIAEKQAEGLEARQEDKEKALDAQASRA
jgi:uncharacterized membrane protein YkvA (DUF1232 family)